MRMLECEGLFTRLKLLLTHRRRPDDFYVTTPIPHWAFMNVTVRARIGVYGPGVSHYPQVNDTFVPETARLLGGEGVVWAGGFKIVTHSTPGLPEQRADGPTTTFTPTGSTTFPQVQSSSITSCERCLGCTVRSDPHAENPASSSASPPVTTTETPKSKTPVGAIAGGKLPVSLITPPSGKG